MGKKVRGGYFFCVFFFFFFWGGGGTFWVGGCGRRFWKCGWSWWQIKAGCQWVVDKLLLTINLLAVHIHLQQRFDHLLYVGDFFVAYSNRLSRIMSMLQYWWLLSQLQIAIWVCTSIQVSVSPLYLMKSDHSVFAMVCRLSTLVTVSCLRMLRLLSCVKMKVYHLLVLRHLQYGTWAIKGKILWFRTSKPLVLLSIHGYGDAYLWWQLSALEIAYLILTMCTFLAVACQSKPKVVSDRLMFLHV